MRSMISPVCHRIPGGLGVTDAEDIAGEVFLQVARTSTGSEGTESSFLWVRRHRPPPCHRLAGLRRSPTADHARRRRRRGRNGTVDADQVIQPSTVSATTSAM